MSVFNTFSLNKSLQQKNLYDSLSGIPENNPVLMREDGWIAQPATSIKQDTKTILILQCRLMF